LTIHLKKDIPSKEQEKILSYKKSRSLAQKSTQSTSGKTGFS
jgi:hypothetical protein